MTETYRIEKQGRDSRWTSDGLGDATGWPGLSDAIDAMRGLEDLGSEWHGVYRVVRESDGSVVHREAVPFLEESE